MFSREKYCRNNQNLNHSTTSKNIISSNKYHQKANQKNKKQMNKKNKYNQLWKKQSSNIYLNEKENDKNNSNYCYNKNNYFDSKKKFFKYQKKLSKTEIITNSDFSEENENDFGNAKINKNENGGKEESKDEKNNSIEYTITTAYSNSMSALEETNPKEQNSISTSDYYFNFENFEKMDNIYTKKSENLENKILNKEKDLNLNEQLFSNSMKNLNIIKLNSFPNTTNELSSLTSTQLPKIKSINKFPSNNASEPYNKYNLINQDLEQYWINPIVENTEILNVNVKISKDKSAVFKLRRFDDLFLTVKLFCEINSIDEKFMKPIIIKALSALNNIYQVINSQMDVQCLHILQMLNKFFKDTFI